MFMFKITEENTISKSAVDLVFKFDNINTLHFLQVIGLYNLHAILRGSVKIKYNINLCYVQTVNWAAIVQDPDDNVLMVCSVLL